MSGSKDAPFRGSRAVEARNSGTVA